MPARQWYGQPFKNKQVEHEEKFRQSKQSSDEALGAGVKNFLGFGNLDVLYTFGWNSVYRSWRLGFKMDAYF